MVGLFTRQGLACPAPALIEDGGPAAPGGIFPRVREPLRHLVPARLSLGAVQIDGLSDGLTRDRQWQGQAPGMSGGLRAWCARLLRAGLSIGRMGEAGGEGRGQTRGLQARLEGAGSFRVDGVEAVD
jgi:hypothetical protein